MTTISPQIDLDSIVDSIATECTYNEIINFILDIDAAMSDTQFTDDLIWHLEEGLEEQFDDVEEE